MQRSQISIASAVAAAHSGTQAQLEQAHQKLMSGFAELQGRVKLLAAERDELGAKLLAAAQREALLRSGLEEIAHLQVPDSNDEEHDMLVEVIEDAQLVLRQTSLGWSAGINIAGG